MVESCATVTPAIFSFIVRASFRKGLRIFVSKRSRLLLDQKLAHERRRHRLGAGTRWILSSTVIGSLAPTLRIPAAPIASSPPWRGDEAGVLCFAWMSRHRAPTGRGRAARGVIG